MRIGEMKRTIVDPTRTRPLNKASKKTGPIIYWMSRDQRTPHNWALLYAAEQSQIRQQPLHVVFTLSPTFLNATIRHYTFMIEGLKETAQTLHAHNIPFHLLLGNPKQTLTAHIKKTKPGLLITDFDPLHIKQEWKRQLIKQFPCPIIEVDAHNIIPCWIASNKQEYTAATLRPKIHRLLPKYLIPFPEIPSISKNQHPTAPDWEKAYQSLQADTSLPPVKWLKPGTSKAHNTLQRFLTKKLKTYDTDRNDPNKDGTSHLSAYLHFGMISSQYIAQSTLNSNTSQEQQESFLEELVIRKELSDNFCYYTKDYTKLAALPNWAQTTLKEHEKDPRDYLYTYETFANAQTHDDLWNAAQQQLTNTGTMHGYLRMYWAKKILEWTHHPQEAVDIAIRLNDTYALDGRDPNGYTGILWSIGGLHDRAWAERLIYGKIRYMSKAGAKRKFDVNSFINTIQGQDP